MPIEINYGCVYYEPYENGEYRPCRVREFASYKSYDDVPPSVVPTLDMLQAAISGLSSRVFIEGVGELITRSDNAGKYYHMYWLPMKAPVL